MRITFKHILFLISFLAFLGAMKAYADITQDLEDQLKELEALNKSAVVTRTPAKLDPPIPLPEKEKEKEELAEQTAAPELTKEEAQALKKITAPKIALAHNINEIQNTISFISGQVFSDEGQVKRETKRTVATETEKKPFNYAADKYKNHRRSDNALKIAKQEETLWQIQNGYRIYEPREVIQNDGSVKVVMPEEPLFDTVAREREARQLREARNKEAQTIENLQQELTTYNAALTSPLLPQSQLDDIIRRYQELLIQPNPAPATKEKLPSGEAIWTSPIPLVEQVKQDAILQSLQDTIVELQTKGEQERVKRILDDVIVEKLNQTSGVFNPDSYPDPKSYKDTIKVFRKVRDSENISVPKYYETEFKKQDTSLSDKVQDVEKLLEESVLNALNEDFSGNLSSAVAQLNSIANTLKARVVALAAIRNMPLQELIARALGKSGETEDERFAAIEILVALMQDPTKGLSLSDAVKEKILEFLTKEYPAYLAKKKEECEKTGQTTILTDEKKLEELAANIGDIKDYLSGLALSSGIRSFASLRLQNVKQLLAQIEAKLDQALASGKLTEEQAKLCKLGKKSTQECIDAATDAQQSLDAPATSSDDFTPKTSSIEDTK